MSTKSKDAVETSEGEVIANRRPTRNLKPISYKENRTTKRGAARSAKESSSELKDKKKKKVKGNSDGSVPPKKSAESKADAEANEQVVNDEDKLMPARKVNSLKKKTEAAEESKITKTRKAKDAVKKTNGESSSKGKKTDPVPDRQSVASYSVTTRQAAKVKKTAKSDSQISTGEAPAKPVEPIPSKAAKGNKKAGKESKDAAVKIDGQDEAPAQLEEPKPSKTGKGRKAVKELNDVANDNDVPDVSSKPTKGRPKKSAAEDEPRTRKRKPLESLPGVVTKPNLRKKLQSPTVTTSDDFHTIDVEYNMTISSWNVAGLRAWVKKDGMDFLKKENPDIFCLQETKCQEDEVPPEANAKNDGYHKYWLGTKKGHAGVAIFSKTMPYEVTYGLDDEQMDEEARLITAEYTKYYVICVYAPNSGRKLVNLEKRQKWDAKFQAYVTGLNEKKPVIICGDMNVAHQEIDLANPQTNKRTAGFTDEERTGMTDLLAKGFIDTYRDLYPDRAKAYTFWTYIANTRAKNIGWRLDYFIVSQKLKKNVVDNVIRSNIMGSDHCPVTMFLKF